MALLRPQRDLCLRTGGCANRNVSLRRAIAHATRIDGSTKTRLTILVLIADLPAEVNCHFQGIGRSHFPSGSGAAPLQKPRRRLTTHGTNDFRWGVPELPVSRQTIAERSHSDSMADKRQLLSPADSFETTRAPYSFSTRLERRPHGISSEQKLILLKGSFGCFLATRKHVGTTF